MIMVCRQAFYPDLEYAVIPLKENVIFSFNGMTAYSVKGKDYIFRNNDEHDFRYENVCVVNKYNGVSQIVKNGRIMFQSRIHINGDFIIGSYCL